MKSIHGIALAIALAASLALPSVPAHAQDSPAAAPQVAPFPDVPADHWAYNAVNELHQLGIVVGYPDNTYENTAVPDDSWIYQAANRLDQAGVLLITPQGPIFPRHTYTRSDFAFATGRVLNFLATKPTSKTLWSMQRDMVDRLTRDHQALDALKRLTNEFTPEMKETGVDVAGAKARLDALERQSPKNT